MHECNNKFAFRSHSTIYTAILYIHCFFFPLVYIPTGINAYIDYLVFKSYLYQIYPSYCEATVTVHS